MIAIKTPAAGRPGVQDIGRYRPELLRFARHKLRDEAMAEDAVQDTFAAAIEGIEGFAGDSSLRTWLTGILRHKIGDSVKRSRREQWLELDEETPADWGDPEEAMTRRRFLEVLQQLLDELPARAARVLVLRDVLGMDTAETCGELAMSAGSCWVMLHRTRSRLRARLAAGEYGPGGWG